MAESKKLNNLWHSALCKMTAENPVAVKIRQKPTKSKYKDKPPYAILVIDGVDYAYNVESAAAERVLVEHVGHVVMLTAEGRDTDATLTVIAAGGHGEERRPDPRQPGARRPEPAPQEDGPPLEEPAGYDEQPPAQPTRPIRPASSNREEEFERVCKANIKFTKARAQSLFMCLRAVREAGREFAKMCPEEPPITAEAESSMVATIYISGDRAGCWDGMPYKPLANYL